MVNQITLVGLVKELNGSIMQVCVPKTKTTEEFVINIDTNENLGVVKPGTMVKIVGSLKNNLSNGEIVVKVKECELISISEQNENVKEVICINKNEERIYN